MFRQSRVPSAVILGAVTCLAASHAAAWGATGHRLIGRAAIAALPPELPQFLRSPATAVAVGELAREPDRWRDGGRAHDADRDAAHFVDLDDDGKVLGGPALAALPDTRASYDAALRVAGADSWKAGYLPYAIIDGWQQLTKDLAYWRADTAAARRATDPARRAWFEADRAAREGLVLRDLGVLAHYVGDGGQPLHVTIHFNGWGPGPNPEGFTQERVHAAFEGDFVRRTMTDARVDGAMTPYADCRCSIARWTVAYLAATGREATPFYRLQAQGAFRDVSPAATAFTAARLGASASALRDVVVDAWRASYSAKVGWPAVAVSEVESGAVDPYDSLYGSD